MSNINWTCVNSYEEALVALNNGAQNISTDSWDSILEYNGNEYSFTNL